jgi:hypothetical protein
MHLKTFYDLFRNINMSRNNSSLRPGQRDRIQYCPGHSSTSGYAITNRYQNRFTLLLFSNMSSISLVIRHVFNLKACLLLMNNFVIIKCLSYYFWLPFCVIYNYLYIYINNNLNIKLMQICSLIERSHWKHILQLN